MDDFIKKFKEEAFDLINDLEKALLVLEKDSKDIALIDKVFRIMHSLKGGGGMFGFNKISEFTHHLESIYDNIRSGKAIITKEILNVTLASVDHIKMLLEDEHNEETIDENKKLTSKILQIVENINSGEQETINDNSLENNHIDQTQSSKLSTYYIKFVPYEHLLDNGTNPLYLLDELNSIGTVDVFPNVQNIPELENFRLDYCYVFWDILFSTEFDPDIIQDIFIFVEDDCELHIEKICEFNLLENKVYIEKIGSSLSDIKTKFDIEEIKRIVIDNSIELDKNKIIGTTAKKTESLQTKTKKQNGNKENIISSIRVSSDKIDRMMNLVSELVTTQASLTLFSVSQKLPGLTLIAENVENLTRQLRDIAFSVSLVPIETVTVRFQRLIRDLSEEFGKDIEFVVEGAETELDKNLIQNLSEPIMHIIRNSIDHGIELPERRLELGKSSKGTILFQTFYSGANVHIVIKDDGSGIDPQMIKTKAIDKELISSEVNFSDKELLNMIFLPGLTTAQQITDISGRGVGMDVVKRKISETRGEVEIESEINIGTTVTIKLPLTLSIIDGLLVKINTTEFIIPLLSVHKIYATKHNQLINSFNNIIVFDGEQIPFHYLREEFNITDNCPDDEEVVVVKYEDKLIGLAVDTVVGEYQAVLKPLGKLYSDQEIFSGSTILGDGTVALVVDIHKMIKIFSNENL